MKQIANIASHGRSVAEILYYKNNQIIAFNVETVHRSQNQKPKQETRKHLLKSGDNIKEIGGKSNNSSHNDWLDNIF